MSIDEELAQVGAILVDERVLRRIIKQHRRVRGIGLQVPHAECYTLARSALEKLVARHEVAVDFAKLPARVVAFGGDRAAIGSHDPHAMTLAWRAIFHGLIHQAFEDLLLAGKLTATVVRERINRIGQTEFDEVRYLLRQEDLLLPPADDTATYTEFVALYLELHFFDPGSLDRTFSTLHDDAPMKTIALDIDGAALLAAARPASAPAEPLLATPNLPTAIARPAEALTDRTARAGAGAARKKGNDARAAILAFRAGDLEAAETDLERLVARLGRALGHSGDTAGWIAALFPLVRGAAGELQLRFTPTARLLLDLQAACVVAERDVRVVDVITWALSRGKRPIVRALPATREVRIAKKVHAAAAKIAACDLPTREDRERLADVLHAMAEHADAGVRTVLRPAIERALDEVQLVPQNLPEQVAEKKIVDELLDHAVSVGRLTFSNLRDAVSQNELKLPDLERATLWRDDQLLRADRALALSLDGVYRPGEIYLRFLQKLSSILFGTAVGRVLCLYILLPIIGGYVPLVGLQHLVEPPAHWLFDLEPEIAQPTNYVALAIFIFLLMHVPLVRRGTLVVLRSIAVGLRAGLVRAPLAFFRFPLVRAVLDSWPVCWIVKPAIPAVALWLLVPRWLDDWLRWPIAAATVVVMELWINTRFGQLATEYGTDWLVRSGRQITRRLVPGILRALLEVFSRGLELSDRAIYRVDEWLRFRVGSSVATVVLKGALGVVWAMITYILRIYLNVFIEPVVNPVKHFPTVTVAGKIMVPFYKGIAMGVTHSLTPVVGHGIARTLAGFTIVVIPGFAGFLVWELKANWKLYAANRSTILRPSAFGHHGETMTRFMKPGFHSGTIPKLFQKLRRATWKSDERGIAKQEEALHHVAEVLEKFVGRELVSLLISCEQFAVNDLSVANVDLASNRIRFEVACPSVGAPAVITFEQQSGYIVAGMLEPGWIAKLDNGQRQIFEIALAGFYKLAAVDIVREQLVAVLGRSPYDISDEGLVVWPGEGYQTELVYNLRAPNLAPIVRGPTAGLETPSFINRHAIYFREVLRWPMWATTWEQLAAGEVSERIVAGPDLLPPNAVRLASTEAA